jgi:transposase InsO family protein
MMIRPPLTPIEQEYLIQRKLSGDSHAEVAQALLCAQETVRKHWKCFRRGQMRRKRGRPARGILSSYPEGIRQTAISLKIDHPHWGPANVLIELRKRPEFLHERLPSCSRLSALFQKYCPEAVQSHQSRKDTTTHAAKPTAAHQCWQIDTKEKIHLGDGELASCLEIRDPFSAVIISAQTFLTTRTPKTCRKLSLDEIRVTLRMAFDKWGTPVQVQTDHEDVYAGAPQSDFPTPFTLWLVGLGIEHVFSRRKRPTDQPHIERNHRTLGDLGWKDQLPRNLVDLQARLNADCERYNQEYPAHASDCCGQPPLIRHSEAVHSGRPFPAETEWVMFSLERVDQYLAHFHWVRKVSINGTVCLGDQTYFLGRAYHARKVSAHYLPEQRAFRFETEQETWIKTVPAKGLEKSDLTGLIPQELPIGMAIQLTLPWRV